jgi:hypothetical protein
MNKKILFRHQPELEELFKNPFYENLYKQIGNKTRQMKKIATMNKKSMKYHGLLDFDINNAYLLKIFPKDYMCPIREVKMVFKEGGTANPNTASLDRIDTYKGYVKGNVQWISMEANRMKNSLTKEKLLLLIKHFKKHEVLQGLSDTDNQS